MLSLLLFLQCCEKLLFSFAYGHTVIVNRRYERAYHHVGSATLAIEMIDCEFLKICAFNPSTLYIFSVFFTAFNLAVSADIVCVLAFLLNLMTKSYHDNRVLSSTLAHQSAKIQNSYPVF